MTALYLIRDTAELKRVLQSLTNVFDSYMRSFTDDGACLEGLYYWGYGMTYLTAFLELYRERTGGKRIAQLVGSDECKITISTRKYNEHDGSVSEITVIDFEFDTDNMK